jgi:hypothetical protein
MPSFSLETHLADFGVQNDGFYWYEIRPVSARGVSPEGCPATGFKTFGPGYVPLTWDAIPVTPEAPELLVVMGCLNQHFDWDAATSGGPAPCALPDPLETLPPYETNWTFTEPVFQPPADYVFWCVTYDGAWNMSAPSDFARPWDAFNGLDPDPSGAPPDSSVQASAPLMLMILESADQRMHMVIGLQDGDTTKYGTVTRGPNGVLDATQASLLGIDPLRPWRRTSIDGTLWVERTAIVDQRIGQRIDNITADGYSDSDAEAYWRTRQYPNDPLKQAAAASMADLSVFGAQTGLGFATLIQEPGAFYDVANQRFNWGRIAQLGLGGFAEVSLLAPGGGSARSGLSGARAVAPSVFGRLFASSRPARRYGLYGAPRALPSNAGVIVLTGGRQSQRLGSAGSSLASKGGEKGGLVLFKWGDETSTTAKGWKQGDRFLHLPNKGSPKANWKQNAGRLREEMGRGNPIFDSYRNPVTGAQTSTGGFLNAERMLLESRGWRYNPLTGAYHPPIP